MGTFWKVVLVLGLYLTCVEPAHGQRRGGGGYGGGRGGYGGGRGGYGGGRGGYGGGGGYAAQRPGSPAIWTEYLRTRNF